MLSARHSSGKVFGPKSAQSLLDSSSGSDSDAEASERLSLKSHSSEMQISQLKMPLATVVPPSVSRVCHAVVAVLVVAVLFVREKQRVSVLLQVPAWKRNVFRAFIATFVVVTSIILRNVFVYVGAIVGVYAF